MRRFQCRIVEQRMTIQEVQRINRSVPPIPTAGKAIEILQSAAILKKMGERKGDRLYIYEPYVGLLK